jgi:hypothetical protein
MKPSTLLTTLLVFLTMALTACGNGCETTEDNIAAVSIVEVESTVPAPAPQPSKPVELPYPVLTPSPVASNPNTVCTTNKHGVEVCITEEPIIVCAQDIDGCPPSPEPAPICRPSEQQGCAGDLNGCFPVNPCASLT